MRKALIAAGLIAVAVAVLLECKSSQAGGLSGRDTFSITVPVMSTDVKQGQTAMVRVVVNRDAGFKQSIRLKVRATRGLDVDPSSVTLRLEERESNVQLRITADKDAHPGERSVMVVGTPEIGQAREAEFRVNVIAK